MVRKRTAPALCLLAAIGLAACGTATQRKCDIQCLGGTRPDPTDPDGCSCTANVDAGTDASDAGR